MENHSARQYNPPMSRHKGLPLKKISLKKNISNKDVTLPQEN
jgi:hypothetical protein